VPIERSDGISLPGDMRDIASFRTGYLYGAGAAQADDLIPVGSDIAAEVQVEVPALDDLYIHLQVDALVPYIGVTQVGPVGIGA